MWRVLKDSKKLACRREFIAPQPGSENRAEYSKVGIFKKLDTNIRQVVDTGRRKDPSMPSILATSFLKENEVLVMPHD